MEQFDYEQFDRELENLELDDIEKELDERASLESLNLEDAKALVCKVYSRIRPILKKILKLPIPFLGKIKRAIKAIMRALDLLCGIS